MLSGCGLSVSGMALEGVDAGVLREGPLMADQDAQVVQSPDDDREGDDPEEEVGDDGGIRMGLRSDAGASPPPPNEMEPAPGKPPAPPEWATGLLGHYALRIRQFSRDSSALRGQVQTDMELLADFAYDAVKDRVRLTTKVCSYRVSNLRTGALLQIRTADALAARTLAVTPSPDGRRWSAVAEPQAYGYTREPPVQCTNPGETRPAPPSQPWLRTTKDKTCVCPPDDGPPLKANDCRVSDPDGDRLPGITADLSGSVTNTWSIVYELEDRLVNGNVASDGRHTAFFESHVKSQLLQCSMDTLVAPCALGPATPCDAAMNSVQFAPLAEGAGCTAVLNGRAELFPVAAPGFPLSGC